MKKYKLFLDESENRNANSLIVAGFAIDSDMESDLNNSVYQIKHLLWDDAYIKSASTVLHCTELSVIKNNRSNPRLSSVIKRDCYRFFDTLQANEIKDKIDSVIEKIRITINTKDITILGCIIDRNRFNDYYPHSNPLDDEYYIALETIIENFVHFLNKNNAVGEIIYESRDNNDSINSADVKMYQNFCRILVNNKGIISFTSQEIQKRIRSFITVSKNEEIPGLEITDFIVFYIQKYLHTDATQKPDILKAIEKKTYNGSFDLSSRDLRNYFGVRKYPLPYEEISNQNTELRRVKTALKKKKDENTKLNNKLKKIILEKRKEEQQLEQMKEELERLKMAQNI